MTDETRIKGLRQDLLDWFAKHKRALPWRNTPSLYGVWVAEVMLQQTTVKVVSPYYERFMDRFPDVGALASAELPAVLKLWSGLGYYQRAGRLHEAARFIVRERAGILPQSRNQWRQLPGIGAYASGSIASIGLGECVPAVDANAMRILARWQCEDIGQRAKFKGKRLDAFAASLVPAECPGTWNEAVMELGALVCRPRAPLCHECPVHRWCRAGSAEVMEEIVSSRKNPKSMAVVLAQLVVVVGNRILLVPPKSHPLSDSPVGASVVRDDFSDLHRGLWGLPSSPWFTAGNGLPVDSTELWNDLLIAAKKIQPCLAVRDVGRCKHAITSHRLRIHVHLLHLDAGSVGALIKNIASRYDIPAHQGSLSSPALFNRPLTKVPYSRLAAKVLAVALSSKS